MADQPGSGERTEQMSPYARGVAWLQKYGAFLAPSGTDASVFKEVDIKNFKTVVTAFDTLMQGNADALHGDGTFEIPSAPLGFENLLKEMRRREGIKKQKEAEKSREVSSEMKQALFGELKMTSQNPSPEELQRQLVSYVTREGERINAEKAVRPDIRIRGKDPEPEDALAYLNQRVPGGVEALQNMGVNTLEALSAYDKAKTARQAKKLRDELRNTGRY